MTQDYINVVVTDNNSDVLQDDDALVLPVLANSTYLIDGQLIYDGNISTDLKVALMGPASATCTWVLRGIATNVVATSGNVVLAASTIGDANALPVGSAGAGSKIAALITGVVRTGATAGSMRVRWAQNSSGASDTTIYADSYIALLRLV